MAIQHLKTQSIFLDYKNCYGNVIYETGGSDRHYQSILTSASENSSNIEESQWQDIYARCNFYSNFNNLPFGLI